MILDKEIPRVSNISRDEFESEFVLKARPVVIENGVSDWKAFDLWTPEYLVSKIGEQKLTLKKSESFKHPDVNQADPGFTVNLSFAEYLNKTIFSSDLSERVKYYVSGDENFFYQRGQFVEALKPLYDDISLPSFFDSEQLRQISFWISVKGLFSWLHFDGNCHHNLNVQVGGSKQVYLIDPHQIKMLYPISIRETPQGFNFSKVDIKDLDLKSFPEFAKVKYQVTVLNKGDMLFIPCSWYHAVDHLGDVNMNVNFWWEPESVVSNPAYLRATLFKTFDQAYLFERVMKEEAPRWHNWTMKEPEIAEFIYKCDELLCGKVSTNFNRV